jgi:importin subunit alpha-1
MTHLSVRLDAVRVLRVAVSDTHDSASAVYRVVASGALPQLVALLRTEPMNDKMQFEIAWVLTNVAAGSCAATQAVVDAGAVPALIELMRSPAEMVREQAIWTLANIAADSVESRDLVLSFDGLTALLCFNDLSSESLIRNSIAMLSNLCRGNPWPPPAVAQLAMPVLSARRRRRDSGICVLGHSFRKHKQRPYGTISGGLRSACVASRCESVGASVVHGGDGGGQRNR